MIKTYKLMKLEEQGILIHTKEGWYLNHAFEDVDLTKYLLAAGMFEH